MREARLYQPTGEGGVVCGLCCHRCHIASGKRGLCGVRENRDGQLTPLVYGRLVSHNIDPIEKKPMFHFLPGSWSLSIATVGCNFQCSHCQNYQISQYPLLHHGEITGTLCSPQAVVEEAVRSDCASISYTYVEPTIFFEFAYDCAQLAHERGVKNVFVSNGYMTPEATRQLAPQLDGINIDLKAFSAEFYRKICKARLEPVLDSIRLFSELGVWVEVTTLIIPGLNDSEKELRSIARFLKGISADIPWHVSAFHPTYKMSDRPATPVAILRKAREIGLAEGLHFVYMGNVPGSGGEDTRCPGCGSLLLHRTGFRSQLVGIESGRCACCKQQISGVWG